MKQIIIARGGGSGGAGGAQAPPTAVISMKPPLSPSYKFEKEEEEGEGLEEEEGEAAPPAMIPGSVTDYSPIGRLMICCNHGVLHMPLFS